MKIYSILKSSYDESENNYCFMPSMFLSQSSREEELLRIIELHLADDQLSKIWMANEDDKDNILIYVRYRNEHEKNFYHGFKIMCLDTDDSSAYPVSKEKHKDLVEKIKRLVDERAEKIIDKGGLKNG